MSVLINLYILPQPVYFDTLELLPIFNLGNQKLSQKSDFDIEYDPSKYNRCVWEHEADIEVIWHEKTRSNKRVFNGSKFRFHDIEFGTRPKILIGITDYKDLLGTHYNGVKSDFSSLKDNKGQ